MKLACLFSGGKDSTFAVFWALSQGFEPILFSVYAEKDSLMFHHPNIEKTELQATALGLKRIVVQTDESNWHADLKRAIQKENCRGIVGGAIASEYQKRRFERIADELDIPSYAPLWHKGDELLDELCSYFETYLTAVAAEGLDRNDLTKPYRAVVERIKLINARRTQDLKDTDYFMAGKENSVAISPFLEGGEGETYVSDAPFFKKRVRVLSWKKNRDGAAGNAQIKEAVLVPKQRNRKSRVSSHS